MKSTLKSFNESESRLPSLAKSNAKNTNLKTIINNKLAALNLSGYNAKMIMNRAEAAGDRLPRSSTWTKNLLGGHLTFGAISAPLLF
jgi:hypothetical protein